MRSLQTALWAILILEALSEDTEQYPRVKISSGEVVGSVAEDGHYYEYLGIPYADSTSGSHRFKAPLPAPKFVEPFIANRRDIQCVRALGQGYEGTEDCLVANVFTPSLDHSKHLPVMVWIKGQEFDSHFAQKISFKRFVEKKVIVVSLNYRESIFGFLCLGTDATPGNAGLKDIIAGLEWIQQNIAAFGGNPNDVSLFGYGTGASAVDLITMSPLSKNLVHKAISQSGNAFSPWTVTRNNIQHAVQVAEALGHTVTTIKDISDILTKVSVSTLMSAMNELEVKNNAVAFSPCLEIDLEFRTEIKPFLTKFPAQILSNGDFLQIPVLTGFFDNELTIENIPDVKFEPYEDKTGEKIIEQNSLENSPLNSLTLNQYIEYNGEYSTGLVSAIREVIMRSTNSASSIYLYQYMGETTELKSSAHSKELGYLLYNIPIVPNESEIPNTDLTVADILIERWTNFAKLGIPSSETSSVTWRPFTKDSPNFLRILDVEEFRELDSTLEIDLLKTHNDKSDFLESIYEEHFFDVRNSGEIYTRDDDDDDDDEGSGEDGDGDGEDDSEEDDSASTAVGYTFSIITLFTILQKIHLTILLP